MTERPLFYELLPATLGDLSQLNALEKACFPLDAWPLIEQIAALTFPADGGMVGFIATDMRRSQNVGWIVTLGVLPAYQRRGIARTLLLACMEHVNVACFRLSVRRSNTAALRLYTQQGFRIVDTWSRYYNGGEDALVLEKHR